MGGGAGWVGRGGSQVKAASTRADLRRLQKFTCEIEHIERQYRSTEERSNNHFGFTGSKSAKRLVVRTIPHTTGTGTGGPQPTAHRPVPGPVPLDMR
jgi:hypothetical protein